MIPVCGYEGRKVAVLGLGRSGLSAARALAAGGAEVLAWDDAAEARAAAEREGLALARLDGKGLDGAAALVVSPGVAHLHPSPNPAVAAAWALGVPVDNDVGLFFRSFATSAWDRFDAAPRVVAVTGSNGKSTTCALIHHVLEEAGVPAELAGNIGRGVLDIGPARDGMVAVLELSSYQLELARALTPDVAVLTNVSPDHLDRHGGMGGYFAAKRRLFAEGGPDTAVVGVDEDEGRFLANQVAEDPSDTRLVRVSCREELGGPGWSVSAPGGVLVERRKGREAASIDLAGIRGLPGAHNRQNACAAYAACRSLGMAPRRIEGALRSFAGLPHRSQVVAEAGGVTYVNDSKATNAESAAQALRAFGGIRWIAGGLGKEGGISGLEPDLKALRKAYLFGHSAREFALQLGDRPRVVCETLDEAVAAAMEDAEPGDTVLLAPAAASFDQYPDFEKRGEDFIAAVRSRLPG